MRFRLAQESDTLAPVQYQVEADEDVRERLEGVLTVEGELYSQVIL